LSGGTKAAYDYLMGQGNYPIAPSSSTGQVMIPYSESVLGIPQSATIPDTQKYYVDSKTHVLTLNPNYSTASTGSGSGVGNTASTSGATGNSLVGTSINVNGNKAVYDPVSNLYLLNGQYYNADGSPNSYVANANAKSGGLMGMAHGGMADGGYNLGGYSDGGRLLRGPGDGVSDDIPATIGHKQPARLADGEFVVPARIVSELGNGSTEAGAKQLYAMMDRVQKARGKTVGKNKVATNTKAAKYLPA